MKKIFAFLFMSTLLFTTVSYAGFFDLLKDFGVSGTKENDEGTTTSGLKEALSLGAENAVKNLSRTDGYFGNDLVKILMPEKIRNIADVLKKVGFEKEVDEFILSMNRAAERAAPAAASYFIDAIKKMSFDDAMKILKGGDTAATEYFKGKTSEELYTAFKPVVSSSMNEVGVTKSYKNLISRYESIPFMEKKSLDLDHYVTNKALDGLFIMIGEEEKKIRTDPAARVTELLKKVFTR